jgi:hypothetical protein
VKISDELKKKGKYLNNTRDDLPEFFKEMGYEIGAEIGVLMGAFSKTLCEAGFEMHAVDPWMAYPHHLVRNPGYQKKVDAVYKKAVRELAPYNCTIIRKASMDALADFGDGSLDFVFIDANHDFCHIAEDLFEWSKKVRVGGTVSGHDYHLSDKCQVQPVVDAYVKAFGVKNLRILGSKNPLKGDRSSWFWVKE